MSNTFQRIDILRNQKIFAIVFRLFNVRSSLSFRLVKPFTPQIDIGTENK